MYSFNLLVYYNIWLSFNMNLQGQLLENKYLIMYCLKK